MHEAIKKEAALRFTDPGVKLEKMINEDMGKLDIEGAMRRMEEAAGTCPLHERLRKVSERLVRAMCKNLNVDDLPTGKRKQWVNDLAGELYNIMKSGRPVRKLHHAIEDVVQGAIKKFVRFETMIDKMERDMKPTK